MVGVICSGGLSKRLRPLTTILNKHILPIYDEQMICYPIRSLVKAGIKDIMIVSGKEHSGQFIELLGDGSEYGAKIVYGCQIKPGGISEAIMVSKEFVGNSNVCVILGDNIFEEDIAKFKHEFISNGEMGENRAHVVCKSVSDAQNYGVLTDIDGKINIVEKPQTPISDLAVTGIYFYTPDVFDRIADLNYSARGELEVTDLNNSYAKDNKLTYSITTGRWWDCGVNIDHLLTVANEVREMKNAL